jgi:hypothetical protein
MALPACLALALLGPGAAAAAPAWLSPVDLSAAGQSADLPQGAVDSQGDAVALWRRSNGTNTIVQGAIRPAGGSWQTPDDLSTAGEDASQPHVAVDPLGDAVAVWERYNGSNWIIQGAVRPAGGAWQAADDLSATGQNALGVPEVAVDSQGDAVAVWQRYNGSNWIIQGAVRPAGGTWEAPVDLSATGQNALVPQVAVDAQGDAVAVWQRFNSTTNIIQGAVRPAGGSWQTAIDLSATGGNALNPQVAVDSQGDAVAVWQRSNGANYIVQRAARPAGGAWQAPTDLSAAGRDALFPQVTADSGGDAVAVWERSNGTNEIVQGAVKPATGAWQSPVDLSATGQNSQNPDVALDPQSNAVAVWERINGTANVVEGAVRQAGDSWQAPVGLSAAFAGASAISPHVAVDSQGDALALWNRNNGTNEIVQGAGYDAAGPLLRAVSIPAAGTAGQPLSFSVSPLDVWSPLGQSSWSFGDGTSANGTSVTHVYAAAGNYDVKLTSPDALGNSTSTAGTIAIAPAAPSPQCHDVAKPQTTLRRSGVRLAVGRSGLRLRGTSRDPSGPCAAGVAAVQVSLARVSGRTGVNCRFLKRANRYALTRPRNCRNPILFRARGTSKWTFTFTARLKPGKYRAQARALDRASNKETPKKGRNIVNFTLR